MNNPQISIIIATYNSGKTLRTALQSVKDQTFQEWECIVVDGASKDNTIEIVKDFEAKDSRFIYISEPDKGIYDAFNKGWKMANGEWVYYLGSDDSLFTNGLSGLMKESKDADIVYGDICYSRDKSEKYKLSPNKLSMGHMVSHQSMIMRKAVLQRLGGFDESYRICADKDLIQKCILSQCVIRYIHVFVAKFNTTGLSGGKTDNLKEAFAVDRKYHVAPLVILILRYCKHYIRYYIKKLLIFR